jgi:RND superfamily putative drug exporter
MFGLVWASITTMVEAGFIIGMGIVLDTFLVRTIMVPALTALIGQANWWPSHLGPRKGQRANARKRVRTLNLRLRLPGMNGIYGRKTPSAVPPQPTTSVAPLHNGHGSGDLLTGHALPLFGPNSLPDHLINDVQETTSDSRTTTNANGKHPIDHLSDHPLPLFGPQRPATRTGPATPTATRGRHRRQRQTTSRPTNGNDRQVTGRDYLISD